MYSCNRKNNFYFKIDSSEKKLHRREKYDFISWKQKFSTH